MTAQFHPLVSRWFSETVGTPTSAQMRGWEAIRQGRHTLIAAPTGSGKTLAAFLNAIDELVREAELGPLKDEVRVVYVSPLKALSTDIHKNLGDPLRGIAELARAATEPGGQGAQAPRITAAVRTGDTTAAERAAMLRTPPHILVTTPESLYLLLTSARGREMLRTARTVIVDEIHAVIGTRRGAHLALSLERLQQLAAAPLLRLGLSATQKPIDEVARFLLGADRSRGECEIVDEGHRRTMDVAIEVPGSPLDAVMSHEVWEEYYDRLTELIGGHRTTLVFVNTRRLAERVARHLSERLGERAVTAHHGSLSKEIRLDAEQRLKTGGLKALVATASLELGIDIGHVDLVCQIGSPRRIATFLQRVGRSGHTVHGTPKGRLFPTSRDDLVESASLLRAVRSGALDRIVQHDAPLDVLAQQLTAEAACGEWAEADLYALVRRAQPYADLPRRDFDAVVAMLAGGFATRRGRRAALLHRDEVNAMLRARRGSRLLALTCGGAIPEVADYRVLLEPDDTLVGTLNEDFAIESSAGDIFQLGNASWQITRVSQGVVRVTDANGAPPTIPFWFGEAPGRSDELSHAVSDLRAEADDRIAGGRATTEWLRDECDLSDSAAEQVADYLADGRRMLGVIPTQRTLVLERFFDESGGMQLVLHAPFGSRINRAWALALRKRFCRQFNFELQAAATEDALLLSLGPQHSFPLADVFHYLHPASARDILVQAFLDAPVFATRWRWNATVSLAVPRNRGGTKVAPPLQRMQADDLLAAVFPDAAACLENIPGDRQIPDHPLVNQTVRDCLQEAMDFDGLAAVLSRIHRGELRLVSRDTPEPSAFAHEILNARPYAFLDDAPLEERRAHAVQTRRPAAADRDGSGGLDIDAIERVRDEERPDPRDPDELHDALVTCGCLLEPEAGTGLFDALVRAGRAARVVPATAPVGDAHPLLTAAERLPEMLAVHPAASLQPATAPPASRAARTWSREEALVEIVRGRLSITGPSSASALASSLWVAEGDVELALLALESQGVVLRGVFTPGSRALEWCDRRLLARIHRYTLNRLRAEIAPVAQSDFMRFLFAWQHVEPTHRLSGPDGLRAVLAQLDGLELPARAWEAQVLAARLDRYEPAHLDLLCLTGEVAWARISVNGRARNEDDIDEASTPTQLVGTTPVALFLRDHLGAWCALSAARRGRSSGLPAGDAETAAATAQATGVQLDDKASRVVQHLRTRGACFAHDIAAACELTPGEVRTVLAELVAAGAVSSDGFAGLRAIVNAAPVSAPVRLHRPDSAGRWCVFDPEPSGDRAVAVETVAWALLRRYGVVFRRLLTREACRTTWRELAQVYRRLEARGEIRGGRFVTGVSGEQFALPDAVDRLREIRRTALDDTLLTISAVDPLNLTGILTPGERIRAVAASRIVYRNGVAVAAMEGDMLKTLAGVDPAIAPDVAAAAAGRRVPVTAGYVGRI